jgi:hypothetical protein
MAFFSPDARSLSYRSVKKKEQTYMPYRDCLERRQIDLCLSSQEAPHLALGAALGSEARGEYLLGDDLVALHLVVGHFQKRIGI